MASESSTETKNQTLETLKQTEQEFGMSLLASTLAHEIRNPLQTIRLQLDAASRQGGAQKNLEAISESVSRLEHVVEKVQRLSHRYELDATKVNLRDLIDSAFSNLQFWLSAAGIRVVTHIDWEGEPIVVADKELLEQVLLNLFMNAVQSMDAQGELRVTVAEELQSAVIEVEDTGTGISPENLNLVGTPFFTTKATGSGLGLAFCKTIATLHGGSLEIESKTGTGTKVTLRISRDSVQSRKCGTKTSEENVNVD